MTDCFGERRPHCRGACRGGTGGHCGAALLSALDDRAGRAVALACARRVAAARSAGCRSGRGRRCTWRGLRLMLVDEAI